MKTKIRLNKSLKFASQYIAFSVHNVPNGGDQSQDNRAGRGRVIAVEGEVGQRKKGKQSLRKK